MKKYQWVLGTLVFSNQHQTTGKVLKTENEEPAIMNLQGDTLNVNIAECRLATEAEALPFEPAEELATEEATADLAERN